MSEIDCQGLHSKAAAHTAVPLVPSPVLPYLLRGHMLPWRKPWQMQIFFRKNSRKHQPPWKSSVCTSQTRYTWHTEREGLGQSYPTEDHTRVTPQWHTESIQPRPSISSTAVPKARKENCNTKPSAVPTLPRPVWSQAKSCTL